MSKIYHLTAKIHELLPQVNQKYGLEIEVEFNFILSPPKKQKFPKWEIVKSTTIKNKQDYVPAIAKKQIRQILVALQEVLGENPEAVESYDEYCDSEGANWFSITYNDGKTITKIDDISILADQLTKPKSQAEALCNRWLDGLTPLFDTNPEQVLTELVEILESLLK